jgi:hypothetical protein
VQTIVDETEETGKREPRCTLGFAANFTLVAATNPCPCRAQTRRFYWDRCCPSVDPSTACFARRLLAPSRTNMTVSAALLCLTWTKLDRVPIL